MQIQLFTTSDFASGRSAALARMIASVERFRDGHPDIGVSLTLLLQRVPADAAVDFPEWIDVMTIAERISLSAARNRMIARRLTKPLDDRTIVAFPDDDAWYPAGTLEHIVASFRATADLDLWFCRYGTAAAGDGDIAERRPTLQQTLSFASSNTTVVSGAMLKSLRAFDEALGVGTPAGGGEDTEFAMRAYHAARSIRFWDVMAVGHRDSDPSIRAKYYAGSLRAIALHGGRSAEARMALARKYAVGGVFALLGRIRPRDYVSAIRQSAARGAAASE